MTQSSTPDTGMSLDLHFRTTAYSTSGPTAAFSGDATSAGAEWHPSTFTPNENSMSEAGTVTYDIGVSETNTATYSLTGLTKAQVVALGAMTGRYLFIRASLKSTGFVSAAIGDIAIQYVAH